MQAYFNVKNVGNSPINIITAKSSCGCADPKVRPSTIASGSVEVTVTSISLGEKIATVTLETDSSITPTVNLQLHIIGSRRPPFVFQAGGDLTFMGDVSPGETREIIVNTMEPEVKSKQPVLNCDLPFLEIGDASIKENQNPMKPGVVHRIYRYKVSLTSKVPKERFRGEVIVGDPWDNSIFRRLVIHGEINPPIKIVPPRITLLFDSRINTPHQFVMFHVITRESISKLVVEPDLASSEYPFSIVSVGSSGSAGHVHEFSVQLKKVSVPKAGEYRLTIRPSEGSSEQAVLPILVRNGE